MLPLWIHSAGLPQPGVDLLGDLHQFAEQFLELFVEFLGLFVEYLDLFVGFLELFVEFLQPLVGYLELLAEYLEKQVARRDSEMRKHYKVMLL